MAATNITHNEIMHNEFGAITLESAPPLTGGNRTRSHSGRRPRVRLPPIAPNIAS